jgi:16S rRNA (adenine1518-N6/adenine1519-N6)-dimethyltransferase
MSEHQPRKRFGQNFLVDQKVIEKIIHVLNPHPHDNLVEIGAGLGALTQGTLERVNHLQIVEIDRDLSAKLIETYPAAKITVYQQDALKFDFASLCPAEKPRLRVFGNLPYNISTPILFHLISFTNIIDDMLFMLQKEVVMRMVAAPNNHEYGRLSIMIQYYCEVSALFDVRPESFSPPPKVMSCMVRLKPYGEHRPHPLANNEKMLYNIVLAAFSHRRKTLKNALNNVVPPEVFAAVGIDPIRRPETLGVAEFVMLSNAIS